MDTERVSDAELAALLRGLDPDDTLHPHTWRLIECALEELQSRRAAHPAGEVERLEIKRLREALTKAAEQFEFYAQEHRQKVRNQMFNGLPVLAEAAAQKAETNEKFSAICRAALNHPGRVK